DLEAAETAAGVRVEAGDILFVRTGFPRRRTELGARPQSEGICALQAACLPWLRERDVAVLGADTGNDVMPAQYPSIGLPVHGVGMGALGLWILDNPDYEELATTCERLGRWEFQVEIARSKGANGTGSPVNPGAMFGQAFRQYAGPGRAPPTRNTLRARPGTRYEPDPEHVTSPTRMRRLEREV